MQLRLVGGHVVAANLSVRFENKLISEGVKAKRITYTPQQNVSAIQKVECLSAGHGSKVDQ